jgi:hypothetical protein
MAEFKGVSEEFKKYCIENNIKLEKNGRVMVFPPMFMGVSKNPNYLK